MSNNRAQIEKRVIQSAESALYKKQFVTAIDIFLGMKTLQPERLKEWRQGKIYCLEQAAQGSLGKISFAMKIFRRWAHKKGLKPSETIYLRHGRGSKTRLRFSKSGNANIERAYRTHYISPVLIEKRHQRIKDKMNKPPERYERQGILVQQQALEKAEFDD